MQYDIEDSRETDRWNDAPPEIKELFHEIEWNIIDGEHEETVGLIQPALGAEVTARTLIAGSDGHRQSPRSAAGSRWTNTSFPR